MIQEKMAKVRKTKLEIHVHLTIISFNKYVLNIVDLLTAHSN